MVCEEDFIFYDANKSSTQSGCKIGYEERKNKHLPYYIFNDVDNLGIKYTYS